MRYLVHHLPPLLHLPMPYLIMRNCDIESLKVIVESCHLKHISPPCYGNGRIDSTSFVHVLFCSFHCNRKNCNLSMSYFGLICLHIIITAISNLNFTEPNDIIDQASNNLRDSYLLIYSIPF